MFELDYRNRQPIYEQICVKIKELIALDILKKGEQLPTVRNLAKEASINPNTIQKAFAKLESEGIIFTVSGKGSFVNVGEDEKKQLKQKALEEIQKVIEKNKIYNITVQDVQTIASEILLGEDIHHD